MKKLFCIVSILLLSGGIAAVELPEKWEVDFLKCDEKTFLKGVDINSNPQMLELSEKVVNLDNFARRNDSAVLRCFIDSDREQTIWLGIGCKVFSLKLNGQMIYDFRQYGLGNDTENVSVIDHKIPLKLQPGRNELLLNTRRTHWKLDYCYGKNRDIRWDLAVKILHGYQPVKAALAHPELVLRPDKDSVMFSFVTTEMIPAGVDYRKKGDTAWLREYDTVGDLILREQSRIHRVRISGIADWGDIEYRLVLLEPPAGRDGFRKPLWASRIYKEVYTPVKTLLNPNRTEFSFLLFGDTQLSISEGYKTVTQRMAAINKLKNIPEFKQADFYVHIGDMDSVSHSAEKVLLESLFNAFAPLPNEKQKAWVTVHGNHETNGIAAENWYDHFTMPGEKGYYSFQLGEVFFIVLDCGDISARGKLDAFNGPLLDMEKLFRKQTQWLKKIRQSEQFRNAGFRVVLSHTEPQIAGGLMNDSVRKLTAELLADDSDENRIHLWIGGHVHRYWRAARRDSSIISRRQYAKVPAVASAPVNWVTVDGPKGDSSKPIFSYLAVKCTPEKLHIKAIDENGMKFDEFTVDTKGTLKEIYRDETLKKHPLKNK